MTASPSGNDPIGLRQSRPQRPIPSAVSADLLMPPTRAQMLLLRGLAGMVGTFIVWAALATLQEVTTGRGRIIPASKIQVVQSLEAGIVREILVREGALVREGDVILRIDPTIAGSSLGEAREKLAGLQVVIARLEAEADDRDIVFPPHLLQQRADLVAHQREQFEVRRRELQAALSALDGTVRQREQEIAETEARQMTLRRAKEIAREELTLVKGLERTLAVSRSEVLVAEAKYNDISGALNAAELAMPRLQAALQEMRGRRSERIEAARGETLQKLASARVEFSALVEASRGNEDRVARTTVRAPASGIVKTVNVTTIGQVLQPGVSVVEIVPMNSSLLVEAQVRPQDIAFLRPGQTAIVKLTAYDFAIYGGLKAKVEQIGADSVTTDKGESYFVIRVRTEAAHLTHGSGDLPIIPGMVADVDVITGSKTVLSYLTKPLTRMRETAMRER